MTVVKILRKTLTDLIFMRHSRSQRPRSFWSVPKIATSGQVQPRKSAIHRLSVTLRMLRVKFGLSDWFWSKSIVFIKPFKTGMSLHLARGRDSRCWPKGTRPWGRECSWEWTYRWHAFSYDQFRTKTRLPIHPEAGLGSLWSCLVPVRLSPRPSRSIDFSDVSQTNGPE